MMSNVYKKSKLLLGHGVERDKVASMVSYISDDNYISNYLGIPLAMVRRIRSAMPQKPDKRTYEEKIDTLPLASAEGASKDAILGSANLLRAMLRYYENRKTGKRDSAA